MIASMIADVDTLHQATQGSQGNYSSFTSHSDKEDEV